MSATDSISLVLCTDGVYPHAMGGMQRHSRLLAEHLSSRAEIELTVIHPHVEGIFDESLGIKEITVPPIDESRTYLLELRQYSRNVADRLDELNPDIILSQGFSVWVDLNKWGSRTIVHPHGLEMFQATSKKERLLGYPFRRSLRNIIRKSAAVISLGGKLTEILTEQAKGSTCQVITIPNAVDVPLNPPPYPKDSRPLRLLFVGRFAFNKGLDLLIEVAYRFVSEKRENDVKFILAGDGPLLTEIKAQGVPQNVEILGRVDDEQLEDLYASSHALILPTRFEGMPTVVLEAMARKRPIIVSDVGATGEQVSMHNGYLLPSGEVDPLYNAICSMLERDPEVWRKMGDYSYQRVDQLFSWPSVIDRFISLFQLIASKEVPGHRSIVDR